MIAVTSSADFPKAIQAATPGSILDGTGIVLTSLSLRGVKNLTFQNFTLQLSSQNSALVTNCSSLQFLSWSVYGPSTGTDIIGPRVQGGADILWSGCEFDSLYFGLSHTGVDKFTVTKNVFSDLRSDGVHGFSSNCLIDSNLFYDFHHVVNVDHSDAIQFDNHAATASAHDITISNNSIFCRNGIPMHGIFVKDEVGGLPYQNLVIEGNQIACGDPLGIWVETATSGRIHDNRVLGSVVHLKGQMAVTRNAAASYQLGGLPLDPSNETI